jgi:hypothetical protein
MWGEQCDCLLPSKCPGMQWWIETETFQRAGDAVHEVLPALPQHVQLSAALRSSVIVVLWPSVCVVAVGHFPLIMLSLSSLVVWKMHAAEGAQARMQVRVWLHAAKAAKQQHGPQRACVPRLFDTFSAGCGRKLSTISKDCIAHESSACMMSRKFRGWPPIYPHVQGHGPRQHSSTWRSTSCHDSRTDRSELEDPVCMLQCI